MTTIALAALAIMLGLAGTAEARQRCGWLVNPNASTWYLSDPENDWMSADAEGYEAEGTATMGDLYAGEYRPINRYYGYACVCMDVETSDDSRITAIASSKQISLAQCDSDEALLIPEEASGMRKK
jgi:hypothetical protein